jgi:hypothetical protein
VNILRHGPRVLGSAFAWDAEGAFKAARFKGDQHQVRRLTMASNLGRNRSLAGGGSGL